MYAHYLTFVKNETTWLERERSSKRANPLQPFRIYRLVRAREHQVYARHLFSPRDNYPELQAPKTDIGAAVAQKIGEKCESAHDFTFYSDLTTSATEVAFENVNPIDALLDEDGVLSKYKGELTRDWYDVFVVNRVGKDTDVQIREGRTSSGSRMTRTRQTSSRA